VSQFVDGNQVTLLRDGAEYFPALEAAINKAQDSIFIQTYIFELDDTGLKIGDALQVAALRGISVHLLLDGFGCKGLSKKYVNALKSKGVKVLFFRPKISPWTLKRNRLRRMHRKMVVVDGCVGFVGGINIIDDYNTPVHMPPRIDYAVKIKGALLSEMQESMEMLWHKTSRAHVKMRISKEQSKPAQKVIGEMRVAFLLRDNFTHRREIEDAYLSAILTAKSEILIANAYFLPGLRFRHALRDAAARGVRVILLLQGKTEYFLLDLATRALYSALLSQGIELYEYRKSFMHSKVAVIDSRLAIVGSSNIDPFSLFLSLEANVAVDNKTFARELRMSIQHSIDAGSRLVTAEEWLNGFYIKRFFSWMAYAFIKLLMGIVGDPEKS
jgi:cardiolipin synthase A/B